MPVTGPSLIHYFGSNLGLEKQGGFADDFDDRLHPVIFFFFQKLRVFQQILHQIEFLRRFLLQTLFENCIELRVFCQHFSEKGFFPQFFVFLYAIIVSFYFFDIVVYLYLLDRLQKHVKVVIEPL